MVALLSKPNPEPPINKVSQTRGWTYSWWWIKTLSSLHPKTSTCSNSRPRTQQWRPRKAVEIIWNRRRLLAAVSVGRSPAIIPCSVWSRLLPQPMVNSNNHHNKTQAIQPLQWIPVADQGVSSSSQGRSRTTTWSCWILGWTRKRPVWSQSNNNRYLMVAPLGIKSDTCTHRVYRFLSYWVIMYK